MNAVRDALSIALRMVAGLVPNQWRAVVMVVSQAVAAADWGNDEAKWSEMARVVADLLSEVEQAKALDGVDLTLAARAAAEVRYTKALRERGLLEVV